MIFILFILTDISSRAAWLCIADALTLTASQRYFVFALSCIDAATSWSRCLILSQRYLVFALSRIVAALFVSATFLSCRNAAYVRKFPYFLGATAISVCL